MELKKKNLQIFRFAVLIIISNLPLSAQFALHLETGLVFQGYNDVRIPGNSGTLFSLTDDLDSQSDLFIRAAAYYSINDRNTLSLLIAPLIIESKGKINRPVNFEGIVFGENLPLRARYRFNSYRVSYRYDFIESEPVEFGLGLTVKIRDAEIRVTSGDTQSHKANVGFVPLVNIAFRWDVMGRAGILIEGDALAAPQGRAEDVLTAVYYRLTDKIRLEAGYRILEGGADNDEVYNFALLHYGVVAFTVKF